MARRTGSSPRAESSSGPVNTSPLGMFRRPSELIHVRPSTLSRRSVPSASIRTSRDPVSRVDDALLARRTARARRRPGRAGRGTARASRTRRSRRRSSAPAARAPASATACRTSAAAAAPAAPAPAPARPGRRAPGSIPASACVLAGASIRSHASALCTSVSSSGGYPSSCSSRRVGGRSRRRTPGGESRSSGHAPRSSNARCIARTGSSASVVETTSTCWPRLDLEAPVAQQRGERVGIGLALTAPAAPGSARRRARAARRARTARSARRRHPVAAEQLLLAGRARAPAIVHETASRSNRSSIARCQASSRLRPPASTRRVLDAARPVSVNRAARARLSASRYSRDRRRSAAGGSATAPLRARGAAAARSSSPRTSPMTGFACPAHAADGSSSASLRIEARACSTSMSNAGCGTRAAPLIPVCGSSV